MHLKTSHCCCCFLLHNSNSNGLSQEFANLKEDSGCRFEALSYVCQRQRAAAQESVCSQAWL